MDEYLHIDMRAAKLQGAKEILDELTYGTYRYNRERNPDISAQSWALVFIDAERLEARYQEETNARKA